MLFLLGHAIKSRVCAEHDVELIEILVQKILLRPHEACSTSSGSISCAVTSLRADTVNWSRL